jgi:hypothetical protein
LALARALGSFCEQQWRAARLIVVSYAMSDIDLRDGWREHGPSVNARCAAEDPVEKNS